MTDKQRETMLQEAKQETRRFLRLARKWEKKLDLPAVDLWSNALEDWCYEWVEAELMARVGK